MVAVQILTLWRGRGEVGSRFLFSFDAKTRKVHLKLDT